MAAKHWIWNLYLALANEGNCTEPEGRATIKALLPSLAGEVDAIIAAVGDVTKLDTELTEKHDGILQKEEDALAKAPVNDAIRQGSSTRKDFSAADATINTEIRASRGRKQLVAS